MYPEVRADILHVVPNGVDEEFMQLGERPIEINIHGNVLIQNEYLLYVGNRVGCKNFEFVLKLYNASKFIKSKNFKIVCIGGGEFSNDEINLLKQYNYEIGNKFINMQKVSNEDLNKIYNLAYALLFPSIYEGFGIPALEAQAAGCPVVYSITSSLPEVVIYPELGYKLDDIGEADYKLQLLENDDLRKKLILSGIEHASKLTWKHCADLTLNVYMSVLKDENE